MTKRIPPTVAGRAKAVLLRPVQSWEEIAGEPAKIPALYLSYGAPLAAIPAGCGFAGNVFFLQRSIAHAFAVAIGCYVASLVAVGLTALAINALASWFRGRRDIGRAFQLSIYAATPVWIAGILPPVPQLLRFSIVAGSFYAFCLVYLGLPRLMRTPPNQTLIFMLVIVAMEVLFATLARQVFL